MSGVHPKNGQAGIHAERGDFDNAMDLGYRFPTDQWGSVRIADNDTPDQVAAKLRLLADIIDRTVELLDGKPGKR